MPQKTARKATTTKKRTTTTKRKPVRKTLLQRIRGSISKKGILVSVGVLAVVGLGAGGYAVWQNTNAGAAGGWTRAGQVTISPTSGSSATADLYICKTPTNSLRAQARVVRGSGTGTVRVFVGASQGSYGGTVANKAGAISNATNSKITYKPTTPVQAGLFSGTTSAGKFTSLIKVSSLAKC